MSLASPLNTPPSEDPLWGDAGESGSPKAGSPSTPWSLTAANLAASIPSGHRGTGSPELFDFYLALRNALGSATHDAPSPVSAPDRPRRPGTFRSNWTQPLRDCARPPYRTQPGCPGSPLPARTSGRPRLELHQLSPNRIGHPEPSKPGRGQLPRPKLSAAAPDGSSAMQPGQSSLARATPDSTPSEPEPQPAPSPPRARP